MRQRLNEWPPRDYPTWGSMPYTVAKPGHYWDTIEDAGRCLICLQPTIGLSTGSLMEALEKGLKELKRFAASWREQQCQQARFRRSSRGLDHQPKSTHGRTYGSAAYEDGLVVLQWEEQPLGLRVFDAPV